MKTLQEVRLEIVRGQKDHYVYVLYKPNDTPIYVGKGCSNRISAHEEETKNFLKGRTWVGINLIKLRTINKIWKNEEQVFYRIDSWHDTSKSADDREVCLINQFGRKILGTGPLTNILEGGNSKTEGDKKYLSEKLKQHCIDNPEFIENLQEGKNRWIEECPEEYAEAERKRLEICGTEEVREQTSNTLKQYFTDNPDVLEKMSVEGKGRFESEEAREQARQNAIDCKSHEHLVKWMKECPEELAQKREDHSKKMLDWHANNKERYMEIASERNKKLRTEEHRQHMSRKTREFNLSPASKERREKANKTTRKKAEIRQSCLTIMHDNLVKLGEIKVAPNGVTGKILQGWKKKGLVERHYPNFPVGWSKTEDWQNFQRGISICHM